MEQLEGFGYFNIDHRATAWNVYTGLLQSASYVRDWAPGAISMFMASMLDQDGGRERLLFELWLEAIRAAEFATCASRLEGLFLFDTPESALQVLEADWGDHANGRHSHFSSSYLSDVGINCRRSNRHDATWITYLGAEWGTLDAAQRTDAARHYWSGAPCSLYGVPIWERLVDGYAVLWGTDLRARARSTVSRHGSASLGVLELARLAVAVGETVGQLQPFLWASETALHLDYRMDYRLAEADPGAWDKRLALYCQDHPNLVDVRSLVEGGWHVPDLRVYSRQWPRG